MGWWVSKGNNIFTRNHFYNIEDVVNVINSKNHFGVFTTAYRYNLQNQDESHLYGNFYLDFDGKDLNQVIIDVKSALSYLNIVFGINPQSCNIYFSGNKGMHITVPATYFGIVPRKDLNIIFKYLARTINDYTNNKTIDLGIYDNKRLFRIPNTIHEKTNLYKVPLYYSELYNCSVEQIYNIAKYPRTVNILPHEDYRRSIMQFELITNRAIEDYNNTMNKNIVHKGTLKVMPPCIKYLLEEGVSAGSRNDAIAILASYYKSTGISIKESLPLIQEWNSAKNSPPTLTSEVQSTVISMYSTDKCFGCTKIKDVLQCYKDECTLKKY